MRPGCGFGFCNSFIVCVIMLTFIFMLTKTYIEKGYCENSKNQRDAMFVYVFLEFKMKKYATATMQITVLNYRKLSWCSTSYVIYKLNKE